MESLFLLIYFVQLYFQALQENSYLPSGIMSSAALALSKRWIEIFSSFRQLPHQELTSPHLVSLSLLKRFHSYLLLIFGKVEEYNDIC